VTSLIGNAVIVVLGALILVSGVAP
jgi:hypothetical protein